MSAMNFWPPKPGSTVITRIISTLSIKGSTALAGVLGFTTTPAFLPLAWILSMAARMFSWVSASTWQVTMSAPASQKRSTYRTGSTIIKWTSRGMSVTFRMDSTTGMPMEMLGTNRPSITSTWT